MKEKKFNATANGDVLTIDVLDEIGPEWLGMISAESVSAALDANPHVSEIRLVISSPGGDVFESFAIYNLLLRHGSTISVDVIGLAASAASVLAMAGDIIRMDANSMMMIHNAWTIVAGSAKDLRKSADTLDGVDSNIVDAYVSQSGQSKAAVRSMMAAETWMNAKEAVAKGFADEICTPFKTAALAKVQAGRYLRTPSSLIDNGKHFSKPADQLAAIEKMRKDLGIEPKAPNVAASELKIARLKQELGI